MESNYITRNILEDTFAEQSRMSLRNCREDDAELSEYYLSGQVKGVSHELESDLV